MNPDKCFPSLYLAIIIIIIVIIIIIIILFVNYYSCAATTTTFTPIDNYLIACGSSQNITFAGRTFIIDSQHSTVRLQSRSSVIATINSSNISPIYQSTRIFTAQDKHRWKILNRLEQEISLNYLQTKHFLFRGGGGFFSFTLPKHFCVFSAKISCNETTTLRDLSGGHGSSFDGRTFNVDSQHSTVRLQSQSSVIATINSSNISPIYQSTRIFIAQDKNLWKILNRVEQEISLTYLQTKHFLFRGGGGFFSFTLPKHFCVFSGKICYNKTTAPRDLMQRDDGAERSVWWP
ncbi:receptor-like protein kinase THESEUS 1 [Senna tora]|uniref:Receptor-like protein kinase THESEUS 1 n=1 Tax=Senna tora TaxID=362788 RepID=A0A835C6S5_9FABA|nr:receptor-like protein kinase THESEUS 1 [Senna tora]